MLQHDVPVVLIRAHSACQSSTTALLLGQVTKRKGETKEKFMLSSNHGSLLRRQPGGQVTVQT